MEKITGKIQHYAWGSFDGIATVLQRPQTGEPMAEYWLGAHPKGSATLASGTTLLDHLISSPELIGERPRARFGDRLPYLLKVLSAAQALSLQAHPSRAQAEEGYARENAEGIPQDAPHRNYRDDWPKPEAMVALTEFHGLCGFRDPAVTKALFERLGVQPAIELVDQLDGHDGIARVFLEALSLDEDEDETTDEIIRAAHHHPDRKEDSDFGLFCRTARELHDSYGDDPGIIVALLLNRIVLQPGEAFFMPAGNLHAYLQGTGLEVMSNSDNVLRGGLTHKHVDVDELARVVDFHPGVPESLTPMETAPGVGHYPIPAPEFSLWRFDSPTRAQLPLPGTGRIVLVTEGEFTFGEATLKQGDAAFFAPTDDPEISGTGTAFLATPGG